ncbi:MAG: epimerase, partial [Gemmatimonas sp. SG8_17]
MTTRDLAPRILLTGATGYVGGRLLEALESRGLELRCMARQPDFLLPRVATSTEVVAGDVFDRASLAAALAGVHTAYYLVHSMGAKGDFERGDRTAAANFAAAARHAGVRRIVYLGGLGDGTDLSKHLESRQEVGRILRESGVPTVEFRASIIIGSGSLSFEMIRALVEKLPVMITPRWVGAKAQPIAVEDVVAYLVGALDLAHDESVVFEIGGSDCVSYGHIMKEYARQRRLRRLMIPVPVLTPALSSLWLGLVTPVYARIGRKLVDSLRNPTVVNDDSALRAFPLRPMGVTEAIARALKNEDREFALTRWSDAVSSPGVASTAGGG